MVETPSMRRRRLRLESLELRAVLSAPTSLTIPLDPTLDQFGDQVLTVQAFGDLSRATFGIFDTGASAVTFSPDDEQLFEFLNAGIPIKNPGGAQASGIGGAITGDVSEPGTILADGLHAAGMTFDSQGFPVFNFSLTDAATTDNVQVFVGTADGSPNLPTITGTPVLEPSTANPNGLAAQIDFLGAKLDFSDLLPGLVLQEPDLHFVTPGTNLSTVTGATAPVTVPLELFGDDNHANPGDSITNTPSPMQPDIQLVQQAQNVSGQHFLLDTGSQLTVISTAAAQALGLDLTKPDTSIDVQGVGGTETVPGFTLDELDMPTSDGGHIAFTHVPVYVLDIAPGVDGLLGTNLWDTASSMLYDPFNPAGSPTMQLTFQTNPDRNGSLTSSAVAQLDSHNLNVFGTAFGAQQETIHTLPRFAFSPDAPLTATATAITATEGSSFDGTVATFSDADPAGTAQQYSAVIDWGDKTALTTITGSQIAALGSLFTVPGSHLYAEEGTYTLNVTVSDVGGALATAHPLAVVKDATLSGTASAISATQGNTFNGTVATFTDADPAAASGDFTATIDWGDGSTTAGTVSAASGGFQVAGSHAYVLRGAETITAAVSDVGGSTTTTVGTASVAATGTPHQRYVEAVFQDVLRRPADPNGRLYWTQQLDSGVPISSVAEAIAHSDEYYGNFVIKPAYLTLLGRAADESGLTYWTGLMHHGTTDQQLEADFISSTEFFSSAGGTNTAWIDAVYRLLLGRAADPAGEAYWSGKLAAGTNRYDVAQAIAGSQENQSQLINDDYFHYLGRAADPAGLSYWLAQFLQGKTNEDVIAGFTGSDEYYQKQTR